VRFDAVAVIRQARKAVREMHAVPRNRTRQCAMQIRPMEGVVRCAERGLNRFPQRRTEQNAAIVPSSLVECHRFDAGLLKHFGKPQSMEQARSVGPDIDAGADFAESPCLLVDVHIESRPQQ
jgi:hypothetical protein